MTEQQPCEVLEQHPGFELRRYPSHAVAEVAVRGSFDSAGNQAFGALFRYITGHNTSAGSVAMTAPVVQEAVGSEAAGSEAGGSETVAMTAPVVQTPAGGGDSGGGESGGGEYLVAFVLPASLTADTAPVPSDPRVKVRQVPERVAAVARYTGRWSESSYRRHQAALEAAVTRAGLTATGPPRFARFNPPLTPWFLRRNEVVQDVEWPRG